jgi:hypothetical protein
VDRAAGANSSIVAAVLPMTLDRTGRLVRM